MGSHQTKPQGASSSYSLEEIRNLEIKASMLSQQPYEERLKLITLVRKKLKILMKNSPELKDIWYEKLTSEAKRVLNDPEADPIALLEKRRQRLENKNKSEQSSTQTSTKTSTQTSTQTSTKATQPKKVKKTRVKIR